MYPYEQSPTEPVTPQTPPPGGRRGGRFTLTLLLVLALAIGVAGGGVAGALAATRWLQPEPASASIVTAQPVSTTNVSTPNVAGAVYNKVSGAVVQVDVSGKGPDGPGAEGSGSGVVVDSRGLILTNNHVVEGARSVNVRFSNGATREARVLGTDRGNDLAVLKVDLPRNVPVASLGDSDKVSVGSTAIAIGSPFGLDETVTQGIISAVHRDWQPGNSRLQRNLIQTDAAINPGNSGGPLLNADGEVIGINAMIESPVRGSVGVGFAIPSNTARRLLPQLEAGAHLQPVWLGIAGQELSRMTNKPRELAGRSGILVVNVAPGGPADLAGLKGGRQSFDRSVPDGGDLITAVDGKQIKTIGDLTDRLSTHKAGDKVTLTILRNGKEQQVPVKLQNWPEETR